MEPQLLREEGGRVTSGLVEKWRGVICVEVEVDMAFPEYGTKRVQIIAE